MRIATLALGLSLLTRTAEAQFWKETPQRPRDATISDTNDARQYLALANRAFDNDPSLSAKAFYWAARLDPTLAEAYYGQRSALIRSKDDLLEAWARGAGRGRMSQKMLALDSLFWKARAINPFLYRRFDQPMLLEYFTDAIARRSGSVATGGIEAMVRQSLYNAGSGMRAWYLYSVGDFSTSLALYADAMQRDKDKAAYHAQRGLIFGMIGNADSAISELQAALTDMRAADEKQLVLVYDSKALLEHGVGMLLESKHDARGARAAFARALEEDLAFYPANVRLALLSLQAEDTSAALAAMDLAAQSAHDNAYVHYVYGMTLAAAGKITDGVSQLREASRLEPYWSMPHAVLGDVLAHLGEVAAARTEYETFLALSSRNAPRRSDVTQKVAALGQSS